MSVDGVSVDGVSVDSVQASEVPPVTNKVDPVVAICLSLQNWPVDLNAGLFLGFWVKVGNLKNPTKTFEKTPKTFEKTLKTSKKHTTFEKTQPKPRKTPKYHNFFL